MPETESWTCLFTKLQVRVFKKETFANMPATVWAEITEQEGIECSLGWEENVTDTPTIYDMTDDIRKPHGVPLVATTTAGSSGAPDPMPRTGPTHTTGGHPRWVMVRRRKRGSNVTSDQQTHTPTQQQQQQQPQEQKNALNILQVNISGISTSIVNTFYTR